MNKGLFIHLIVIVLYILSVMYIFQENTPTKFERAVIVIFLLISQLFTFFALTDSDSYKKKIIIYANINRMVRK